MSALDGVRGRLGVIGQVIRSFSRSGRLWMLPMIGVLVLLGLVLAGLSAVHYVAPFIYAVL
ncbi:MAG: DUF5989 family protein [Pseudomonadota bacterium]|nr:DUF5989 family protein [Pseudomonadota bacterium]